MIRYALVLCVGMLIGTGLVAGIMRWTEHDVIAPIAVTETNGAWTITEATPCVPLEPGAPVLQVAAPTIQRGEEGKAVALYPDGWLGGSSDVDITGTGGLYADLSANSYIRMGAETREQVIAFLRTLEPGLLASVGYIGDDGDWHALTKRDLAGDFQPFTVQGQTGDPSFQIPVMGLPRHEREPMTAGFIQSATTGRCYVEFWPKRTAEELTQAVIRDDKEDVEIVCPVVLQQR